MLMSSNSVEPNSLDLNASKVCCIPQKFCVIHNNNKAHSTLTIWIVSALTCLIQADVNSLRSLVDAHKIKEFLLLF